MVLRGIKRGLNPNYIYYDFSQKVINWNQTTELPIKTLNNLMEPKLTDQVGFLKLLLSLGDRHRRSLIGGERYHL